MEPSLQLEHRKRGKAGAYSYPRSRSTSGIHSLPVWVPDYLLRDPSDPSDHAKGILAALQTRPVLRARLQTDAHPDGSSSQCLEPCHSLSLSLDTRDGFHGSSSKPFGLVQPSRLVSDFSDPGLLATALLRLFVFPTARNIALKPGPISGFSTCSRPCIRLSRQSSLFHKRFPFSPLPLSRSLFLIFLFQS
ncbi:hypothetical protein LX32DRAFT_8018 [Colletotrichum zoysiae]|uniref:Uncharacterized protein n=1 Tax=Colletotrichum zoysiae TaxID=1216348 RepID=A0AAD9M4F7_9PEZI|nr:hypothetical protein LX32DRAFT_8018 [Colletotrichum zoysiae]